MSPIIVGPSGGCDRLFPHVSQSMQGVILTSLEQVQTLIDQTTTQTGLRGFATILDQVYETGRKVEENFNQTMDIVFDGVLPQWNYVAKPHPS
ncbi:MAG: hypothetical protein F6K30_22310 [Cyanothece sp. SIO2G6]|nr:hypothetical protein [Cyanothece sp. SIO2G6]